MRTKTSLALSIALMVTLSLVRIPLADAKVPGTNGQIVFELPDPASQGDTFVFVANADGSGQHQLVPTHSCCARWSPDGSRIATAASASDGRITTAIVNPDGSGYQVQNIPDPTLNLECSAWSPNGTRFACEAWDDTNPNRTPGIFTVRTSDFGGLQRLTANPYGGHDIPADYSPDGTSLVFSRENAGIGHPSRVALFVANISSGAVRQITGWQADFTNASWSPDGKWILAENDQGGIFVVHPDGTARHQIPVPTGSYKAAFDPVWSPDGTKILLSLFTITAPGTGQEAMYTANPDGSDLTSTGLRGLFELERASWSGVLM